MSLNKIPLRKLMDLRTSDTGFLRAASGLVKVQNDFCVIADDDLSLAIFSSDSNLPAKTIQLQPGTLPEEVKARKKVKPDWEALVSLTGNTFLVIPSGSKPNRHIGYFLKIQDRNVALSKRLDFSEIFSALFMIYPELNIEGGAILDKKLKLFQRGNGSLGQNAIIDLDLFGVMTDIRTSEKISAGRILKTTTVELGLLNGIKLSFTDACSFEGQLYFIACAENTTTTFDDGEYLGSVIGTINEKSEVILKRDLECHHKPEGLWVEKHSGNIIFYVVTDADDPKIISSLYMGSL